MLLFEQDELLPLRCPCAIGLEAAEATLGLDNDLSRAIEVREILCLPSRDDVVDPSTFEVELDPLRRQLLSYSLLQATSIPSLNEDRLLGH